MIHHFPTPRILVSEHGDACTISGDSDIGPLESCVCQGANRLLLFDLPQSDFTILRNRSNLLTGGTKSDSGDPASVTPKSADKGMINYTPDLYCAVPGSKRDE